MNIVVIGAGGREHAIAWKISQSPVCKKLYLVPGNAGTSTIATNVPISINDFSRIGEFCIQNNVNLIVVGPEIPLVGGIRDYFLADNRLKNILIVGPGKQGAQLEGSKHFAKQFMHRHLIPTAQSKIFTTDQLDQAIHYAKHHTFPLVVKADGLAAGKGVIVCYTPKEAEHAICKMLKESQFGIAGHVILIEDFLDGNELSVFILTDGQRYQVLPAAKDYKRIGENDTGPNTGGMGAVSPPPSLTNDLMVKISKKIIEPTLKGLDKEKIAYRGFIFFGLMDIQGEPYVIEYNIRMGDPETQVIMPLITNDIVPMLVATAKGELDTQKIITKNKYALTVVMASAGYPQDYLAGFSIQGINHPNDALIFHAGTAQKKGNWVTKGGRVLAITGQGDSLVTASKKAYDAANNIQWQGAYYRRDIGKDLQQ